MRHVIPPVFIIVLFILTACGGAGSSPMVQEAPPPQQDAGLTSPFLERYRDYLYDVDFDHFGYWQETMINQNLDNAIPAFSVFEHPVADQFSGLGMNEITYRFQGLGTFTYSGKANGMYSLDETIGEFLADVEMTAEFDRPYPSWVSGQVFNFTTFQNQPIDPRWEVELPWGRSLEQGRTALGGGGTNDLRWDYEWYDSQTLDGTTPPRGIGGTFSNSFDNGNVTGAFGATRTE